MTDSKCPCGRFPDPGVRPGGGCYCCDLPACEHGAIYPDDCAQCTKLERDRYRDALRGIYGIATTPTEGYNEQPAAKTIAKAIEKVKDWD